MPTDIETEEKECSNCGVGEHEDLGHIPPVCITGEVSELHRVKCFGCTGCGEIRIENITEDDVIEGDKKLINFLFRNGHITEEEAKEMYPEDWEKNNGTQ